MSARLQTLLVADGTNIPLTAEAEQALAPGGVLALPECIANAGGVICAAVEYRGGTETAALALIRAQPEVVLPEVVLAEVVLSEVRGTGALPRSVAMALAVETAAAGNAGAAMGRRVSMNCARSMSRRSLAGTLARGLNRRVSSRK